jgi:hypothetical protein
VAALDGIEYCIWWWDCAAGGLFVLHLALQDHRRAMVEASKVHSTLLHHTLRFSGSMAELSLPVSRLVNASTCCGVLQGNRNASRAFWLACLGDVLDALSHLLIVAGLLHSHWGVGLGASHVLHAAEHWALWAAAGSTAAAILGEISSVGSNSDVQCTPASI